MKNINLTLYILIFSCFFSCKSENKETSFLDEKHKVSEKIKWILNDENIDLLFFDENSRNIIKQFYKKRNYKSLWSNDTSLLQNSDFIIEKLRNPIVFGIPTNRINFNLSNSSNFVLQEIELSKNLLQLQYDLKNGFFDTLSKKHQEISYSTDFEKIEKLAQIRNKDQIAMQIISWGPSDTSYQNLAKGLYRFASKNDFKDENLKVMNFKKDSIQSKILCKKALIQKGYLDSKSIDSLSFTKALMQFQFENGIKEDGVIGQFTADALNETNLNKCKRASLVLEKLRKQKINEKRYFIINIPEYTLRFYADDTLKSVNKVVVGKFDTKTPEFSSQVSKIVAFPFWNVPYSITSKEILPDAKKNPNYFERNNMKIYNKDGEELDPYSVNWKSIRDKTFPYKVIQQPGYHNSLGIIKFEFSNKYGVYVHDTPSKSLFNTDIRSYSHGCIRCEKPVDLAKTILIKDENKVIPDSLDSIITRKVNHPINLKRKIPIYIVYQSAVYKQNTLIFLRDLYHKDKILAKYMFD
jgi:murein L,D-transpeptidase YcbB/YkuD